MQYYKQPMACEVQLTLQNAYYSCLWLCCPSGGVVCYDKFVCLSVCPRAYLWNRWTDLHKIIRCHSSQNFLRRSPVAVAWSSSGDSVTRYVLPVLRTTSRLAVVGHSHADHAAQFSQVTWLVITEVRSTQRHYYNAHPITMHPSLVLRTLCVTVKCGIACLLCPMRNRCAYSTFRHHRHPYGAKIWFVMPSIAQLARGEKSCTQSLSHSLTQLIRCAGNRSIHFGKQCKYTDRQHIAIDFFRPIPASGIGRYLF